MITVIKQLGKKKKLFKKEVELTVFCPVLKSMTRSRGRKLHRKHLLCHVSSSFLEWYLCVWESESGYLLGIFAVVTSSHSEFLPFILIMLPLEIYMCLWVGTYHEKTSISTLAPQIILSRGGPTSFHIQGDSCWDGLWG